MSAERPTPRGAIAEEEASPLQHLPSLPQQYILRFLGSRDLAALRLSNKVSSSTLTACRLPSPSPVSPSLAGWPVASLEGPAGSI